jgi:hypothetical protein
VGPSPAGPSPEVPTALQPSSVLGQPDIPQEIISPAEPSPAEPSPAEPSPEVPGQPDIPQETILQDESLEPITTPQQDEVHGKECNEEGNDNAPSDQEPLARMDALEPIVVKQPDEVHTKECTAQSPATASLNLSGLQSENLILANALTSHPSASVQPMIYGNATANPLAFASRNQSSVNKSMPYRLEFGDPDQGPKAEAVDRSEIYRTTRSQLRETGRNVGARRNSKTLKKHYVV